MNDTNIFRSLNEGEKKDTVQLGSQTLMTRFLVELANAQSKYAKKYIPFDAYGARIDFDNYIKQKVSDIVSTVGGKVDKSIDFDFSIYAQPSRFVYMEKSPVDNTKILIKGGQVGIGGVVGYRYKFKTITRGNQFTIYIPADKDEMFIKWLDDNNLKKIDANEEEDTKELGFSIEKKATK